MTDEDFGSGHKFAEGNKQGHKIQPGERLNPNGPPAGKVQLWRWITSYMDMDDKQFAKLKQRTDLKQSQQAAVVLIEKFKAGHAAQSELFTKYVIDREQGKAVETVKVTSGDTLNDDECEAIRDILRKNGSDN